MFGYVRPLRDELKIRDDRTYWAAYCGLCRDLSRRFGFRARFLVNYDMTFLYLLRASTLNAAEQKRCWCPAKVCGKQNCFCDGAGYESVSAFCVILSVHKLRDNIRDNGFFRSVPYRLAALLLRRAYRRAVKAMPEFDRLVREQLDRLSDLEAAHSPSIDATADAFARIIEACAADLSDPAVRLPMQTVLYQVGRFIYLADALDDLAEDCRRDAYNPLRFRFAVENGALKQEDRGYLTELTDSSVNLAGAALELLPMRSGRPLLENIVYYGLPSVFAVVREGLFNHLKKDHPRKERFE